jgi:hypothetical protein
MARIDRVGNRFHSRVPEEATAEPPILTPEQMAERASRRRDEQEHDLTDRWPQTEDPLRQPGEMSPAPEKRR